MELNVEEFMKTKMGVSLYIIISRWDHASEHEANNDSECRYWKDVCCVCQHEWEIFKLALKQFYGIEFFVTRTDDYFGVCTEDESVWLMKIYRKEE